VIDPLGNISESRYDGLSRVTQQIAPHPTLTEGLKGFWSFLEDTGTTTADLSGNNHTGTLTGDPTRVQGRMGSALRFDPDDGNGDYVALGNPADLDIQGAITLSAWVEVEATDGIRNIVAHGYTKTPPGEVFLRIKNGYFEVGTWDNDGDHLARAAIDPSDVGRWVHLTGMYDPQAGHWRLFRDGVEFTGTDVEHLGTQIAPVSVASDWAIGSRGTDEQTSKVRSTRCASTTVP